jgi:GNAT superfamily N-acetyltransferase
MPRIEIFVLGRSSPEISACAKWRVEAFGDVLETDVEAEKKSLEAFTSDQSGQVAVVAKLDGILAGICLLVRSELEPCHPVSPWLAGLYVAPEHRRHAIGRVCWLNLLKIKPGSEVIAVCISTQIARPATMKSWVGPASIKSIGEAFRQL